MGAKLEIMLTDRRTGICLDDKTFAIRGDLKTVLLNVDGYPEQITEDDIENYILEILFEQISE